MEEDGEVARAGLAGRFSLFPYPLTLCACVCLSISSFSARVYSEVGRGPECIEPTPLGRQFIPGKGPPRIDVRVPGLRCKARVVFRTVESISENAVSLESMSKKNSAVRRSSVKTKKGQSVVLKAQTTKTMIQLGYSSYRKHAFACLKNFQIHLIFFLIHVIVLRYRREETSLVISGGELWSHLQEKDVLKQFLS